jgi:DNA-binding response OmpR family regulator
MKSILLVDDEPIICAEFERTLRRFGFHVEAAHTVEAALRSVRRTQFDAILLEFNLKSERNAHPRTGNGLRLVHQLRTRKITSPVLVLTAMEGEPYETTSLDAGADDFILKTAGITCLVSRLRAHFRRHERDLGKGSVHGLGRNISRPS